MAPYSTSVQPTPGASLALRLSGGCVPVRPTLPAGENSDTRRLGSDGLSTRGGTSAVPQSDSEVRPASRGDLKCPSRFWKLRTGSAFMDLDLL
ncbi:hypothetical protein NDU88_010684 [Pleurodeles waltl]|uniref:Uncharacterized protein n=1 Tax=Pleurodeles waltl TaxID=8319 RepID=A0AAV7PZG6_PLEWA|nr:hypothetical protein NDU88_010684 [Pleurodeles waltl]